MQIPKQAEKKFSGVLFDIYQWEQEMFDGSKETFEMLNRSDTVQVLAVKDGKILLSKESQPSKANFTTIFGGRLDENEDPLDGAKRELLEESGMASEKWELLKEFDPYHKMQWTEYLYIAKNCKKVSEQKLDPGEKIEVLELNFDEFFEKILDDDFQSIQLKMLLMKLKIQGGLEEFKKRILEQAISNKQ